MLEDGFRSEEGKTILDTLQRLARLLNAEGFKEAGQKVIELHGLSASAVNREEIVATIKEQEGAEGFLISALAHLRRKVASLAPARPASRGPIETKAPASSQLRHVVLNCANIGCDFGENVEQRGAGSKFSWEGVERACSFYDKEGFVVHAIIGQRLLHKAGREQVSAKLNDALVVIPSRDEMRDNDDFSTILEAYKYKCQFVDNDNYRDWGLRIKNREVAAWYGANKHELHIAFYFDRFGHFTPLKGALPQPTKQARSASARKSDVPKAQAADVPKAPQVQAVAISSSSSATLSREKRPALEEAEAAPELHKRPRRDPDGPGNAAVHPGAGAKHANNLGHSGRWKTVKPTAIWPRWFEKSVDGLRPLRSLKAGDIFRAILQRPEKGEPVWLAIYPRGWVHVCTSEGAPNVVPI